MKSRLPLIHVLVAVTSLAYGIAADSPSPTDPPIATPALGTEFEAVIRSFSDEAALDEFASHLRKNTEGKNPNATHDWLMLSAISERRGRKDEAILFCQKAAALDPENAQASQSLADVLFTAGQADDAIAALRKALVGSKSPATRRERYRQLALGLQRRHDADGALETWRQLTQEFPKDLHALAEAGDAMADEGRFTEAASFYEALGDSKDAPDSRVLAIMRLGQLAEARFDADKARLLYQSALALVGVDAALDREIRLRIDDSYRRVDDLPGLAAAWQSYLGSHGSDSDAVLHLCAALFELRRNEEAAAWLRKAAEWSPDRKDVKIALARALAGAGQPKEAVEILQGFAARKEHEPADVERLAEAQWQLYRSTQDEAALRAATETWQSLAPSAEKDPQRILQVAKLLRDHGLKDEALALYQRAAALAPEQPQLRERWADYLTELGRADEARKTLQGFAEGDRATSEGFLLLARAQFQRHEIEGALASVRAGLAIEPQHFELLSLESTLFAASNQWQPAADLAGKLLAAAPSVASAEQVGDNYAQALRRIGKQETAARQYAQWLEKGTPLSEIELRLFAGLALRNGNLDLASKALDDGGRRFPDSPGLLYERAEYERRRGHIEQSVAAFERLAVLQPAQKEAWLRQIARAYSDEHLYDNAQAAARRVVEAAPDSPDALAFAARIEEKASNVDASFANWKKALELSAKAKTPVGVTEESLRSRLARAFLYGNRFEEEREARIAAFNAESDPVKRLAMTAGLGDAFMRTGRLDELLARFREKRDTEKNGWQYAVYLADIYRAEQDPTRAQEELAKATGVRSRELLFLAESWRISAGRQGGDRAHFARLLEELDPSEARQRELASSLLGNSETAEALRMIQSSADSVERDPLAWHDTLLRASAAGLGDEVVALLQSGLRRHADDWRLRFMLAEAKLRTGDFAGAEAAFREVELLPVAAEALPADLMPDADVDRSPDLGMSGDIVYASGAGRAMGSEFARRNQHGYDVRQLLSAIAAGLNGISGMRPQMPSSDYDVIERKDYLPATPGQAADAALIIRSIFAQQEGRGGEFLASMEAELKNVPRAERIARYSLVQALDPLMKEVATESAFPSGDEALNASCFEVLMALTSGFAPGRGTVNVDWPSIIPLMHAFLQREKRPETLALGKVNFSEVLKRAGRENEAREVAREALSHWDAVPELWQWKLFNFAMEVGDPVTAEKIAADPRRRADSTLASEKIKVASAFLAKDPKAVDAPRLLAEALRSSFSPSPWNLSSELFLSARSALRDAQAFPYGYRVIAWSNWAEVFDIANRNGLLPAMKAAIDEQTQTLPHGEAIYARLARVCFAWWSNDRDTAIRDATALAEDVKTDESFLFAGSMLMEAGRHVDAQKWFDQARATSGAVGLDKLARLLVLARAQGDNAKAKRFALQLADFRLSYDDQSLLDGILGDLGLADRAAEFKARRRGQSEGAFYSGLLGASQQLRKETQANHKREAIDLAESILSRISPSANSQSERAYRIMSFDALRQFRTFEDYTQRLEQDLADHPDSRETQLNLAEALGRGNASKAAELYRRVLSANPDDLSTQMKLALLLAGSRKTDEAVQVWEAMFARAPEAALGDQFATVLFSFQKEMKTSQLGAILLAAPAKGNPLESLAFVSHDDSFKFDQIATALDKEGKADEAIRLWRASLVRAQSSKTSEHSQASILKALVPALMTAGRKDEAEQELERYFFPPQEPKPVLGYQPHSTERSWAGVGFGGDLAPTIPATSMMRLASAAGALEKIRARAVAASNADPQAPEKFLVLLIDALRRDPVTFPALQKRCDEAIESARATGNQSAINLQIFAQVLGEWPDGRALALHVDESISDLHTVSQGRVMLHRAELALALKDNEKARKALQEWIAYKERATAGMATVYAPEQITAVDLMSRASMGTEADSLLKKLQATSDFAIQPALKQRAQELADRLSLLAGDVSRAQINVWASPGPGDSGKTKVYWEIGTAPGEPVRRVVGKAGKPQDPPLSVNGEDLAALDGKFTVELYCGASPSALQPLTTIAGARMRGVWESPQPLGQGYVVASLRTGEGEAYSANAFVAGAPNLLSNPEPAAPATGGNSAGGARIAGWPDLKAGDFAILPGGPDADGRFLRVGMLENLNHSALALSRIPLKPGKSYFFAAWMQARGNGGRAGLSGRFLDKEGKEIGQASPAFTSAPGRWYSLGIQMGHERARGGNGMTQIPQMAAYFEPLVLPGFGFSDVAGLYFGELNSEPKAAQ